jgi:hydroxymethylglutaryl-CoA lyase
VSRGTEGVRSLERPGLALVRRQHLVPVEVKAEFVSRLVATGLQAIEVTSLVHPRWVPQLADADALLDLVDLDAVDRMPVLVPNTVGLERAMVAGVHDIAIFASATETFARRNLNRGLDEQYAMFEPVVARARGGGLRVRGYLSMCFGDPWEGAVPIAQVVDAARRLVDLGCDDLSLGDTVGVATPGHVARLLRSLVDAGTPVERIGVHFHDTYGQALANALTAMRCGVTTIDSSAGGLGGCPYAESATGNLATEDLVWQLNGLGIETGIDLAALVRTSVWMARQLGRPSPSAVVRALAAEVADA